jgi:rhamnulokinase
MVASCIPTDARALVAVDLGAESCRVSLLRWLNGVPSITLVHRFPNAPRQTATGLRWDLDRLESGMHHGLALSASLAEEGIRSIAVDGWAVDYVVIDEDGLAVEDPYCYRDERTVAAEDELHQRISPDRLRELTGVQLLRINTLYQRFADVQQGRSPKQRWLNLPEYFLHRLGGEAVAELTNATHTQLVEMDRLQWSAEIFHAAGLDMNAAPMLVSPGSVVGKVRGILAQTAAYSDCLLIAPGCHDTASAIAGIAANGENWAYISAGTWSLVGSLVRQPINDAGACADNFTNLCAVGGRLCFHKNVNGMWLLRQCMQEWASAGHPWMIQALISAADVLPAPEVFIDVDRSEFLEAGPMMRKINEHLEEGCGETLAETPNNAPAFANLIFHSLAAKYAQVIQRVTLHTGKEFQRIIVVGGASQNQFLNSLTEKATGLKVVRGPVESSTVGNFATQLATLEADHSRTGGVELDAVTRWAALLGSSV